MRITQQQAKALYNMYMPLIPTPPFMYGSRVNDAMKGGDVDIAIVSDKIAMSNKVALQVNLYDVLEGM